MSLLRSLCFRGVVQKRFRSRLNSGMTRETNQMDGSMGRRAKFAIHVTSGREGAMADIYGAGRPGGFV